MNPDSFFREVLESHQFRSSDIPTHFSLDPMLNLNVVLVSLVDTNVLISLCSCFCFIPGL